MVERNLERLIFASRWLLAPFYLGLVGALLLLLIKFVQKIVAIVPKFLDMDSEGAILAALSLIDLSLMGNLLLMVVFSGYENFVSKLDVEHHEDRPDWMGSLDFGDLKLKLMASIVAISAIHVLEAFMNLHAIDKTDLAWTVGIHLVFVVSGLLLALMDRISHPKAAPKRD